MGKLAHVYQDKEKIMLFAAREVLEIFSSTFHETFSNLDSQTKLAILVHLSHVTYLMDTSGYFNGKEDVTND